MIKVSCKDIDDDFLEEIYTFIHLKRLDPEEGVIPEMYDILSQVELPPNTPYFVQFLQGGTMLGAGWKIEEEVYDHPVLARTEAYNRCKNLGNPTRILIKTKKGLQPVCLFFKEEEKVYSAIQLAGSRVLKQEILFQLDENGGEITVEELEKLERNLGTQKIFGRMEY